MSNRIRRENIASQSIGSGSWTEIYSVSKTSIDLTSFLIKLNTNKMDLRITLDPGETEELVVVDVDLQELTNDFKVSKLVNAALIYTHHNNIWVYQPREPQWCSSGFKIELKSQSGNKSLEGGYVEWSDR